MTPAFVATEVAARQTVAAPRTRSNERNRCVGLQSESARVAERRLAEPRLESRCGRAASGLVLVATLVAATLMACHKPRSTEKAAADTTAGVRLANPASKNCVDKGGTLAIEQDPSGGQFGVCSFPENHQCEEWAMLRGHCPVGGIKVTGFVTPASRFCGITGGEYSTTGESNTAAETGTCVLPSGEKCDADAYFRRTCPPTKSSAVFSRPFEAAG